MSFVTSWEAGQAGREGKQRRTEEGSEQTQTYTEHTNGIEKPQIYTTGREDKSATNSIADNVNMAMCYTEVQLLQQLNGELNGNCTAENELAHTSRQRTPLTFSRQQRRGPRGSFFPSCSVAIKKALVFGARTIGLEVRYTT